LGNQKTGLNKVNVSGNEINEQNSKIHIKDYKTNGDILSEIKSNPVVKKIRNYGNKWIHVRRMDRDGLPHFINKYQPCGK
jgi:hypothetical protein